MHEAAEFGSAAHWDYKQQIIKALPLAKDNQEPKSISSSPITPSTSSVDTSPLESDSNDGIMITEESQAGKTNTNSYIEALNIARSHLIQKNVFIFVSPSNERIDGEILNLPLGSTVSDALIESDIRYNTNFFKIIDGGEVETNDDLFFDEISSQHCFVLNGIATGLDTRLRNGDVLTIKI